MIFLNFSQPEANYTIECIILVDTFIATHCMKNIFRHFMTAAVIVILVNTEGLIPAQIKLKSMQSQ